MLVANPDTPAGLELENQTTPRPPAGRRGRLRRRLRYLRRARELMLRDLGGLLYEVHRSGGGDVDAHATVLTTKVQRISGLDAEAHALETALASSRPEALVFEPGIGGTCPNCGELFSSAAHFCANCGASVTDLPAPAAPAGQLAMDVEAATPMPSPTVTPLTAPERRRFWHKVVGGRKSGAAAAAGGTTGAEDATEVIEPDGRKPEDAADAPTTETTVADAPVADAPAGETRAEAPAGETPADAPVETGAEPPAGTPAEAPAETGAEPPAETDPPADPAAEAPAAPGADEPARAEQRPHRPHALRAVRRRPARHPEVAVVSTVGTPPTPGQPPEGQQPGVAEPPAATVEPQPQPQQPQQRHCPRCGAAMTDEQEWCLNCGAAVGTRIVAAPGWRVPIIVTALLGIVGAIAIAIAIIQLADDTGQVTENGQVTPTPTAVAPTPTPGAEVTPTPTIPEASGQSTPEPTPSATPSTTPEPTPSSTPGSSGGAIGEWPSGQSGWTVVLASKSSESAARDSAEGFQADGIPDVGLLNSDDYASLNPGYWVVYSGEYDSQSEASAALDGIDAKDAYIRRIDPN